MKVSNFEVKFIAKKALIDRSVARLVSFFEILPIKGDFEIGLPTQRHLTFKLVRLKKLSKLVL